MEYKIKKYLVENSRNATLEGVNCKVFDWGNGYATLVPDFGGYWQATWETVKIVMERDRKFVAADVSFLSWGWLGIGVEMPEKIKLLCPQILL